MKLSIIILIFAHLLTSSLHDLWAATDQFGQDVPANFESKINQAKEYRLPYPSNSNYDPNKSIAISYELLQIKPDYYRAYYNLGLAYSEIDDYENANKCFDEAFKIRAKYNIQDVTIFNSAGWVSMKYRDYQKAENLFKQGIALKDKNKESSNRSLYNNLGVLYFNTQRFDEAKKYLTIAKIEYNSENAANTLKIIEDIERDTKTIK
jgi:tetratricopeptide (TPR) repeat protein